MFCHAGRVHLKHRLNICNIPQVLGGPSQPENNVAEATCSWAWLDPSRMPDMLHEVWSTNWKYSINEYWSSLVTASLSPSPTSVALLLSSWYSTSLWCYMYSDLAVFLLGWQAQPVSVHPLIIARCHRCWFIPLQWQNAEHFLQDQILPRSKSSLVVIMKQDGWHGRGKADYVFFSAMAALDVKNVTLFL